MMPTLEQTRASAHATHATSIAWIEPPFVPHAESCAATYAYPRHTPGRSSFEWIFTGAAARKFHRRRTPSMSPVLAAFQTRVIPAPRNGFQARFSALVGRRL